MSEFKVGDRVITKWGEDAASVALKPDDVPEGEHVIVGLDAVSALLDNADGWWYPLSLITKVDDAPEVKDDGGPAFPVEDISKCQCPGMSLRDYFAAKAMQGDWAAQDEEGGYYTHSTSQEFLVRRAKLFFRMADAMLEARKK